MTEKIVPELFFKNGVSYEITVNPSDSMQHFASTVNRLNLFVKSMSPFMEVLKKTSTYDFYLEVSEQQKINNTTSQPRLHYHGMIKFNNVASFMVFDHYVLGRALDIQFNHFRPDYWIKYIAKQKSLMSDLCAEHNVRYHLTESNGVL